MLKQIIHDPAIPANGRLLAPVEVLRSVTRMCDRMPESFTQRFTIAELVRLWQVAQLCEWDYDPCWWTEDQIADALDDGIIPTWHKLSHR